MWHDDFLDKYFSQREIQKFSYFIQLSLLDQITGSLSSMNLLEI